MNGSESIKLVEVVVSFPVGKNLQYRVPEHLASRVTVGVRVLVPVGRREVTGFVVGVPHQPEVHELKEVVDVLDDQPVFTSRHLSFYQWVSNYYFTPLGVVLKVALPRSLYVDSTQIVALTEEGRKYLDKGIKDRARGILEEIAKEGRIYLRTLKKTYKRSDFYTVLNQLEGMGLITKVIQRTQLAVKVKREKLIALSEKGYQVVQSLGGGDRFSKQAPLQAKLLRYLSERGEVFLSTLREEWGDGRGVVAKLEKRGFVTTTLKEVYRDPLSGEKVIEEPVPHLNLEQQEVLKKIEEGIRSATYTPFLLYGVTGSGKTEVYLRAIEKVLHQGREAIVLVPEISLTPQLVNRFRARFGDELVLLHSRLSPGERFDGWRRIRRGMVKIAVGARSAIFAPFSQLGIIVVDEEHDASYKQEEKLRYHARDLALVRAKIEGAVVILGSATPSLESYYNAQNKKCTLLRLTQRVEGKPLPAVEIVDLRKERLHHSGGSGELSGRLKSALRERLDLGQQSLLFLNRRGFAPCVMCKECGYVFRCSNCSVSLIHHQREKSLRCHYCGYTMLVPETCPHCGGLRIQLLGCGTERLEEEVGALFPHARIERMDRDTTGGKGGHKRILSRFTASRGGVLIGTQMITKGHDLPQVTLVGVVSADVSLHFPDFRSSERTFQLLTQVAGRAGRGAVPGEVIVQTFHPHHYSIRASQRHDYEQFYQEEFSRPCPSSSSAARRVSPSSKS
ncbi:MAG: primosomal protein N' [candidate division WOR-3 bacterium]